MVFLLMVQDPATPFWDVVFVAMICVAILTVNYITAFSFQPKFLLLIVIALTGRNYDDGVDFDCDPKMSRHFTPLGRQPWEFMEPTSGLEGILLYRPWFMQFPCLLFVWHWLHTMLVIRTSFDKCIIKWKHELHSALDHHTWHIMSF
jgi:hypothetical protein